MVHSYPPSLYPDPNARSPKRSADLLAQQALSSLRKDYFVIGKRRIRSWHAWLMIGIIAGGTFTLALVANRSGRFDASLASNTAQTNASPAAMTQAQQVNALQRQSNSLRALQQEYRRTTDKRQVEEKMLSAVRDRLDILERLMQKNPRAALQQGIQRVERDSYPPAIRELLEEDIDLKGSLEVAHGHNAQHDKSFTDYILVRGNDRLQLYFTDSPRQNLVSGMQVRVTGMRVRNRIALPE